MNDLEGRIDSEFSAVDQNLQEINDNLTTFHYRVNQGVRQISDDGVNWENFNQGAELLWTNSAPTSSFNAQTEALDLTEYEYIIVEYFYTLMFPNQKRKSICFLNEKTITLIPSADNNYSSYTFRPTTMLSNGVQFALGSNKNNTQDADYAIPINIWGCKTELGS